jgi:hypothetical protein
MNTLSDYIREGYSIVSSHGGGLTSEHYLVLQKETSVVVAKLTTNAWTGKIQDSSTGGAQFFEVSK